MNDAAKSTATQSLDDELDLTSAHVLLVDDHEQNLDLLQAYIEDLGCRISTARDGVAAKESIDRDQPDLILLDLGLPRIDGRKVLTEIKSDYDLQSIPVVVLTASTDHEDKVRSQCLDVEGYMVKPVDLNKFLTLVRELNSYWLDDVILPQA